MRFVRRVLLATLALLLVSAGAVYGVSAYRLSRTFEVSDSNPTIPSDSVTIERGRHLVTAITMCVDCHGDDLGGKLAIDAGPVGKAISANLTRGRGGIGSDRTDSDLVRAIRHGVRPDGTPLRFMPSSDYSALSDDDVAAVVAYVRSVPPVDRVNPPSEVGPLGRLLFVAGKLPLLSEAELVTHDVAARQAPSAGVTVEYGRYLAAIGGCQGCHGTTLSGGQVPGTPPSFKPASNITPTGIGSWSEADFFRALRDGKRPGGTSIDPFMPVKYTKNMTDDEIRAVYLFLKTVPPEEYGNR